MVPDIVGLLACVLMLVTVVRWRSSQRLRPLVGGEAGFAAVTQFVLIIPFLLSVLLVIFQIALIMHAKLVVNYAAFAAARSAIVMLPALVEDDSGRVEHPNQIDLRDPEAPKLATIRRAAALACVGISPAISGRLMVRTGVLPETKGLGTLAGVAALLPAKGSALQRVQQMLMRAPYALSPENTTIQVAVEHKNAAATGSRYALVTVKVRYRYYLTVPFASRLFGTRFPGLGFFDAAYYAPLEEEYTLFSETDPIFPEEQSRSDARRDGVIAIHAVRPVGQSARLERS